jgi:ribonuclease HIII
MAETVGYHGDYFLSLVGCVDLTSGQEVNFLQTGKILDAQYLKKANDNKRCC